jgi:drug/metabolite transporter (DMT)-like permease
MSSRKTKAPLGASLVVLSSGFYASYGVWTKLMGNFFSGYTASALRSVLVLVILVPLALGLRKFEPLRFKKNFHYLAGLVVASCFIWGPLYYSILHAGISLTLTVAYASIVIGMFFFGWLMAGERFTKDKAISAALGVIGLALIFSPGSSKVAWLPLCLAAISGLGSAFNTVIVKKIPYNATQATVVMWVASVIANTFMAIIFREKWPAIGAHVQWLYLVLFAVASVIATWSLVTGVKLIEAGAAGVLGLLEIVFGVGFGMIFFHERPGALALIGAAVIIAASAIPYIKDFNISRGTLESD